MVSGWQDLVFTGAIPTQARRNEMPRSCVPDIDVMDPQDLDPVDMDGKCVNPHEAVKEALTTKTTGARANPTPLAGGLYLDLQICSVAEMIPTIARRCRRRYVPVWLA